MKISLFTGAIALIATTSASTAKETCLVPTRLLGRTARKAGATTSGATVQ